MKKTSDNWSNWILKNRFGDDEQLYQEMINQLLPVRENVLKHAKIKENETILDVGCGDGFIGFGALEMSPGCNVIFSDISRHLLDEVKSIAEKQNLSENCSYVCNYAENLCDVESNTVDVVTARSVLIYIQDKEAAFNEFARVLKPGGRLSIFEPINSYANNESDNRLWGIDITPVKKSADKIKIAVERENASDADDPMLNFTERDLVNYAEKAGFDPVHLSFHVDVASKHSKTSWDVFKKTAPNPNTPTIQEIIENHLPADEVEPFSTYMRNAFKNHKMMNRHAVSYLWGTAK